MALSDWAPEIISLEDDEDTVNLCVYGYPGSGKTVLAGSDDRVLFLAPEDDGTLSAKRQGSTANKWPIRNLADFEEAIDRIEENIDEVRESFDWLAIDSATHMQRLLMRQILEDAVEENPERDIDTPALQDWNKYYNKFQRLVQLTNALEINTIWTATVKSETDEEGDDFVLPDIQGRGYQEALTFASQMTSYGYLKAEDKIVKRDGEIVKDADGEPLKKTVRTITWRDTGKIRGKDRTNALAPVTKDLTLKQIRQLITGEKTREDFRKKPARKTTPAKKTARKVAKTPLGELDGDPSADDGLTPATPADVNPDEN
ncbi:AAA-ATPase [Gordonia phage LittleFella]|nr:AAA-ATPase [Gordonia phage LittleFella]